MENILNFLKQLELSEIEAKLYLTLLKNGPTSVRDLAETIDIKRTTTYFYIDQLIEKGLIMKLVKGSKKMVAANPPETLQHLVEQKVASAKLVEQRFPSILASLTATLPQNKNAEEAEIKYYKGKNGVKKIYEESLRSKELRSYINLTDIENIFPENFQLFDNAFKHNKEIKMYEIVEDSPLSRKQIKISSENDRYFCKLMPKDMKLTAQDILIYDDKVSIINLKDKIDGVVLSNSDFYNNSKILFDFIWRILPDVK